MYECVDPFVLVLADPSANGDPQPVDEVMLFHCLPDSFGYFARHRQGGIGKDDQEFFAAVSTRIVRRSDAFFHNGRHIHQNLVPVDMAFGVIDFLEIVNVKDRNRKSAACPA